MSRVRRVPLRVVALASALLAGTAPHTADLTVCPSGCDHSSIQAAVDAAAPGDELYVAAGTYRENVVITKDVVVRGQGAHSTIVDGKGAASHAGTITIRDARVMLADLAAVNGYWGYGYGSYNGGGVAITGAGSRLTMERCAVRENFGYFAGGVFGGAGTDIVITSSVIAGNYAYYAGGVISLYGSLSIGGSAIYDNFGYEVGGIAVRRQSDSEDVVVVRNTTIAQNGAFGSAGGVEGAVALDHVTIADNHGRFRAVGGVSPYLSRSRATVVANNGGGDCFWAARLESDGYNLDSDGTCGFSQATDHSNIDPRLEPLRLGGGAIPWIAALPGSVALDGAGNACSPVDQRGITRPVDGDGDGVALCDIGAVERTSADRPVYIDQQHAAASGRWLVGYRGAYAIAQTIAMGRSGLLEAIRMSLRSESDGGGYVDIAILAVEAGQPSEVVLRRRSLPLGLLPGPSDVHPSFRSVLVSPPLQLPAGSSVAIVVSVDPTVPPFPYPIWDNAVSISAGAPGADYERGNLFFRDRSELPWRSCTPSLGSGCDLVFETIVVPTNSPPTADAGEDTVHECTSPGGALLTLDGSSSSDPDSPPGTNDDITGFHWIEDLGLPSERSLGYGEVLPVFLAVGSHAISLRVVDSSGDAATDTVVVGVVDSVAPELNVTVEPATLWPPNHRWVDAAARVVATDACSTPEVVLISIASSEPEDAAGDGDGSTSPDIRGADNGLADFRFDLRAERDGSGGGRAYSVTYSAADTAGNTTDASFAVSVPHSQANESEPLQLSMARTGTEADVRWTSVADATLYHVIRGSVERLGLDADSIGVGQVECVGVRTPGEDLALTDSGTPGADRAFFYLVGYEDSRGRASGFGTVTASKPRSASDGGCD